MFNEAIGHAYIFGYATGNTDLISACSCLRVPLEIVVWICDIYEKNSGIENDFTLYLMKSCYE